MSALAARIDHQSDGFAEGRPGWLLAQRRLFTVSEYHGLAEAGVLAPDERSELIEGEVFRMSPVGSRHAAHVRRLTRLLVQAFEGVKVMFAVQDPIRLSELSEPQPDLAVLKWREDDYADAHPTPSDVLLVVEVSDSTLRFDRQVKLPLYARHRIPELWIVDLQNQVIDRFTEPTGGVFAKHEELRHGDALTALNQAVLDVASILG